MAKKKFNNPKEEHITATGVVIDCLPGVNLKLRWIMQKMKLFALYLENLESIKFRLL